MSNRDDSWMYDEDLWEEDEETKDPPPERQCRRCLHWVPRESTYCTWCGKSLDDK